VQEGFCNSLLEAQGTGLLCIASDAEGLSENVLHGVTGWITQRRDSKGIAAAVERVLLMPNIERLKISSNAIQRVQKEFCIDRLKMEFNEFYV
jgi:colanic acid/amylovoran biosynthesis glycosyltransferase